MKRYRKAAALGLAGILAASTLAWGAGLWPTLPGVGEPSFCASNNANTPSVGGITGQQGVANCVQTVPAGPPMQTGVEQIPADTQLANGAPPQSVTIASALIGSVNSHYNRIMGGDFGTNLWQRPAAGFAGISPATYAMTADRWFAVSANNVMTITKSTPSTSAADYLGQQGFYSWMRVARPSGTPSGSSCVGQILDSKQAADLIGKNGVLSFYGYAPSTFSASNFAISVSVAYYTAADSATPGTNTATAALSASGQSSGIAGYQAAVAGASGNTVASIASGVATINLSATPTLYAVYAPIPATNASGTEVTGVIVSFCATPTATATQSTDYFEIEAVQLQAMPMTVTASLPAGVTGYTGFERVPQAVEAARELQYSYVVNEPSSANTVVASGVSLTTATCALSIPFPVEMREAPTYTNALSASTFGVISGAAQVNLSTPFSATKGVQTVSIGSLVFTTGATQTQWDACQLVANGTPGSGVMTFLAEP